MPCYTSSYSHAHAILYHMPMSCYITLCPHTMPHVIFVKHARAQIHAYVPQGSLITHILKPCIRPLGLKNIITAPRRQNTYKIISANKPLVVQVPLIEVLSHSSPVSSTHPPNIWIFFSPLAVIAIAQIYLSCIQTQYVSMYNFMHDHMLSITPCHAHIW